MKKKTKLLLTSLASLAWGAIAINLGMTSTGAMTKGLNRITRTVQDELDEKGVYYSDFDNKEEAYEYAAEVNRELSREGNVVLKNLDSSLPLSTVTERRVSIFGHSQDDPMICGTGGTVIPDVGLHEALEDEGFILNDRLHTWYKNNPETRKGIRINMGSDYTYSYERTDFDKATKQSFSLYNDVAIVYLSRFAGEGADLMTSLENRSDNINYKEGDEYKDENKSDPDEHEYEISGYKHLLELSDYEQELIDEVESYNFKKIVVVLNSSNVMECGTLLKDPRISGIIWQGRPGANGFTALAEILDGKVNPSGRTSDIWLNDLTADPTWVNFGLGEQVNMSDGDIYYYEDGTPTGPSRYFRMPFDPTGYFGVDYEEGIYVGYKYWETRYAEIYKKFGAEVADTWYEKYVCMPFGGGLGYSTFSFEMGDIYTKSSLADADKLGDNVSPEKFASSIGNEASVKRLYVPVKVTNTGTRAGKQTVEVYVEAPYGTATANSSTVEKSAVVLTGFDKTKVLQPGESETVVVEFDVQDFASYDAKDDNSNNNKGYELDPGEYKVWALDSSHIERGGNWGNKPHDVKSFTLTGTSACNLVLDDYSGKAITNKFSEENGIYYSERKGRNSTTNDEMTVLSRKDFDVTTEAEMRKKDSYPKAPTDGHMGDTTVEDYTKPFGRMLSKDTIDSIVKWELFEADKTGEYSDWDKAATGTQDYSDDSTDNSKGWNSDVNVPDSWRQAESHTANYSDITIKLKDMANVDPNTSEGSAKWVQFMNQLTWDELKTIAQNVGYGSAEVESIGKLDGTSADSPENFASGYDWCDEAIIAATFNTDLVYQHGIITADLGRFNGVDGWYGPGANLHRSAFGGRNYQYYSQDGIHAGIIGAADAAGAESRGCLVTVKHFLTNDAEVNRASEMHFNWVSEQALREVYMPAFKMPLQEGNAGSVMTACARIGMVPSQGNYNLITGVLRDEMDWHGYAITDGFGPLEKPTSLDLMMRTGTMPLGDEDAHSTQTIQIKYTSQGSTTVKRETLLSGEWNQSNRGGKGGVDVGGTAYETYEKAEDGTLTVKTIAAADNPVKENENQYYFVRKRAQEVLFNSVHSYLNYNGVEMNSSGRNGSIKWTPKSGSTDLGTFQQGDDINVDVSIAESILNDREPVYSVDDLPDGLELEDGKIKGVASGKPGTYKIKVSALIDGWISGSCEYTITISSNISWTGDDVTTAQVGKAFSGYVETDITAKSSGNTGGGQGGFPGGDGFPGGGGPGGQGGGQQEDPTLKYTISDGTLPDGLTLADDGRISGTPTASGTYDFVVTIDDNKNTYDYEMTIVVKEADAEVVEDETSKKIKAIEDEIATLKSQLGSSTSYDDSAITARIKTLEDELKTLKESSSTKEENSSGCSGSVLVFTSALASISLLSAGLMLKKKKEDK